VEGFNFGVKGLNTIFLKKIKLLLFAIGLRSAPAFVRSNCTRAINSSIYTKIQSCESFIMDTIIHYYVKDVFYMHFRQSFLEF
jgi:hypothetical protein